MRLPGLPDNAGRSSAFTAQTELGIFVKPQFYESSICRSMSLLSLPGPMQGIVKR